MRWPLRNQIMLPMVGVMLGALVGVSVLNAYLSGQKVKQQIERQLREVSSTLSESSFPLTEAVLRQMRGLTGAEFVVLNDSGSPDSGSSDSGQVVASSMSSEAFFFADAAPLQSQLQKPDELTLGEPLEVGEQWYFHAAVQLQRLNAGEQTVRLHILYPEQSYREVWRQAVYPPLVIGAVALLLVVLFAVAIASRVVRPMLRLQNQVGRIAEGDFRGMELPLRDDEVRDLSESVNRMARLLSRYEDEVRQSERLHTLGQLGSGIAHQLRNSATGCRLAIELHQRECSPKSNCDCLEVANRQITLMEKQLKRFLSLGKPCGRPLGAVNLAALVENTLPLLQPFARHVGVSLEWTPPAEQLTINGDLDALEQVLLNLLLNAIEAASRHLPGSLPQIGNEIVTVQLAQHDPGWVSLEVADSGAGPACTIEHELFEPFVTDKADGTGLGLSVAREIVAQHGGEIRWHRRDNTTCFSVELPLQKESLQNGATQKGTFTTEETPRVEVTRS